MCGSIWAEVDCRYWSDGLCGTLVAEHDFGDPAKVALVTMQSEDLRREALALSDVERADLAADPSGESRTAWNLRGL